MEARWRAVLPIWSPLIPGHVSHPRQVLEAGSSPLGGPRQGPFKPSPADRLQGSVGPSWLPSHSPPLGGTIPGKLETKEGRCRSPGLPFISSLSQSVKGFHKFCSSAAAGGDPGGRRFICSPEDRVFRNFQPLPPPPTLPGTSPKPHVAVCL